MTSPGGAGSGEGLTVRLVTAEDDLGAGVDLWHRAFGPPDPAGPDRWQAELTAARDDGHLLGAWDGARQVALAHYHDMRQWWHGGEVPMAGVSGVAVAPEARRRGVGRALMTGMLRQIAADRYPLAVLYPATSGLYRSLGWEIAGGHYLAEIPARSLARLVPPDPVAAASAWPSGAAEIAHEALALGPPGPPVIRRATPRDAEQVIAVLGAIHSAGRHCGPATRDREAVARELADGAVFSYLAPDGFLAYTWADGRAILVHTLVASTPATLRDLWSIVATHSTIAGTVRAAVAPADPVSLLTAEPDVLIKTHRHWMLRVVDPEAAIAHRGFPAGVAVEVMLALTDPHLPSSGANYQLRVGDRGGFLYREKIKVAAPKPSGPWITSMGPRGFAAMYAGAPMAVLRQAGLVFGGDRETDEHLDAAFGASAYLLDYF